MRNALFAVLLTAVGMTAAPALAQDGYVAEREVLLEKAQAAPDAQKPDRWADLARFLDGHGAYLDAAYAWGQARKGRPERGFAEGEARALLNFAEQVLAAGESGAATKAAFVDGRIGLERAAELGADGDWIGIGLARCAAALGRTDEQIKLLEDTLKAHPGSMAARRALAFALFHAGKDDRATAMLDSLARELEADVLKLSLTTAVAARRAGDEARAVAAAERAVHAVPGDPRGWLALWQIYAEGKRFGELADRMTGLAGAHRGSGQGAHYAGFACSYAERTDDALHWLGRAVEINGKNLAPRLEIAKILRESKQDRAGAVEQYAAVLAERPAHEQAIASLRYMGAQLSDREGKPEEAVPLFRMIAESLETQGVAWADLALALRWSGRDDEADGCYERAISWAQEDAQIRNDHGLLLLVMGRDDEAIETFQEAHAVDDRHNDAVENLGFVARERGDAEATERWFHVAWEAAVAIESDDLAARHRRNLDDARFALPPLGL